MGDGLLLIFDTVTDAVECCIQIQEVTKPIDDLVLRDEFIFQIDKHIDLLKQITIDNGPAIIIGAPRKNNFLTKKSRRRQPAGLTPGL